MPTLASPTDLFMARSNLSNRLSQATKITSDAAQIAQSYFNDRDTLSIAQKSPGQYVTKADQRIEEFIRTAMHKEFPGESIVGEEFGGHHEDSYWTIDPIDGSANFLNGLPFWGVAIGHATDTLPDLGVVVLPQLQLTVAAEHKRLYVNGNVCHPSSATVPSVSLGQADPNSLAESLKIHENYRNAGISVFHWRCSALSLTWTALGQISGHVHRKTSLWDAVPGAALCSAAGLDVRMGCAADNTLWIKAGEQIIHTPIGSLWETDQAGAL